MMSISRRHVPTWLLSHTGCLPITLLHFTSLTYEDLSDS